MNRHDDARRPQEIEDDIERTRAEVGATIEAIQERLTPGQIMDEALRYLRASGAGDFGSNLGRQVRDNPLPVALIGVGVAWLAMGGRTRTEPSPWDEAPATHARRASTGPVVPDALGAGPYEDDWSDSTRTDLDEPGLGSRIAEAGASAGERVREAVSGTTGRVLGAVSGTTERLKERVSGAARRGRDVAQHRAMRERLGDAREGARSRVDSLRSDTRMRMGQARERTMRMIDEQPLVLGAIGVAIGAALGAAMPRTRREDALLGETRDDLMEGAGDAAREGLRGAASSARRVVRTAREELERAIDAPPAAQEGMPAGAAGVGTGTGAGTAGPGTPGTPGTIVPH